MYKKIKQEWYQRYEVCDICGETKCEVDSKVALAIGTTSEKPWVRVQTEASDNLLPNDRFICKPCFVGKVIPLIDTIVLPQPNEA